MQRLEQDVFFGGTITSMFLVGHTDGIPHGAGSGTTVHSTTCGLGWRFGVRCDYSSTISSLSSPSVEIYFDALLSDPTLRKLAYTVSVTAIEAASATSVNNPKNGPPAVSCIVGEEPANGPNTPIPPRPAAAPRALGGLKGKSLKTPLKGYSSMTSISDIPVDPFFASKHFTSPPSTATLLMTMRCTDLIKRPVMRFTVSASKSNTLSSLLGLPGEARVYLSSTILTGISVDVKFWTFSRRITTIQDGSPHIGIMSEALSLEGFREAAPRDLFGPFPEDACNSSSDYDYESDSDLDDEEPGQARDKDVMQPVADAAQDEMTSPMLSSSSLTINSGHPTGVIGRVIFLENTAFRTWHAFIFYLHTGRVNFLPLRSSFANDTKGYQAFIEEQQRNFPDTPPPCSPKSMYRLADEHGHVELREKALEAIKERVISQNVVVEAFSLFTSWYPDIQAFQTRLLQKSLHIGSVRDSYNHKVRAACDGELPRAFQVLTTLTKALIDNQKE